MNKLFPDFLSLEFNYTYFACTFNINYLFTTILIIAFRLLRHRRCYSNSSENLIKNLMTRIKATGPVTVAEYMREGLTSPTEVRLGHCYRLYVGVFHKSFRGKTIGPSWVTHGWSCYDTLYSPVETISRGLMTMGKVIVANYMSEDLHIFLTILM